MINYVYDLFRFSNVHVRCSLIVSENKYIVASSIIARW